LVKCQIGFIMSVEAKKILEEALHLSQQERAIVAEGLLFSLDSPDPAIDELWANEVEAWASPDFVDTGLSNITSRFELSR